MKLKDTTALKTNGGMIIYYKNHLEKFIKTFKKTPNYVWIDLKKELFHSLNKDLELCVIYNPPINSTYYNPRVIEDILKSYKRLCRFKQIEFWKNEKKEI